MTHEERFEKIDTLVSQQKGIPVSEILGSSLRGDVVIARHLCKYLCKIYSFATDQKVAKHYKQNSHGAVAYSVGVIQDALGAKDERSKIIAMDVKVLKKKVAEEFGFPPDLGFND